MKEGNKIITITKTLLEGKLSQNNKKYLEYSLVFLNEILSKQARISNDGQDKFVTFSFERRSKLIPKYYISSIEEDLIKLGLLEKDSTYSKEGGKAQGFRLTDEFFKYGMTRYNLKEHLVSKRLEKYLGVEGDKYEIDLTNTINRGLVENSKKFELMIPKYEVSTTSTSGTHNGGTSTLFSSSNANSSSVCNNYHYVYQFLETSTDKKKDSLKLSRLINFAEGREHYSRKETGDRFYSKLQQLPKEYRHLISYSGNPLNLVQLDISCSQPALLAGILNKQSEKKTDDLLHYIDCVTTDSLYEVFKNYSRKEAKKGIMLLFFGEEIFGEFKELETTFAETFPSVYEYLNEIKREDYHKSSELLRMTEAHLILDKVCGTLNTVDSKDFAYLTIHDAIIVPENYAKLVSQLIKVEFNSLFGFECHVKEEKVTDGLKSLSEYSVAVDSFKLDSYDMELLCSQGRIAVYSQKSEGKVVGYEIHQHSFKKNVLPNGKVIEKWFRPSTSQWGKQGYTKYTLSGALTKYSELLKRREGMPPVE